MVEINAHLAKMPKIGDLKYLGVSNTIPHLFRDGADLRRIEKEQHAMFRVPAIAARQLQIPLVFSPLAPAKGSSDIQLDAAQNESGQKYRLR